MTGELAPGEPVTLDNCAREPIHIPGAIQPHGALLACDPGSLRVRQVSANASSWFGEPPAALLGIAVDALVRERDVLRDAISRAQNRETTPLQLTLNDGRACDALLSRAGDVVVVELEARSGENAGLVHGKLRDAIVRMQRATDLDSLRQIAAVAVRALTGFDRVMAYRFDLEWNGEVVAEDKRADLEPFLHQHYPASDIPAQARRLYTINWLRMIGDVAYTPVPLQPPFDPDRGVPDLPALIMSVLDSLALSIEAKELRLKRVIDPQASPVLGDPVRLRQIIANLATNAIKFTPKGGTITIVLRKLRSDVEIVVQDTGKGIPPEFIVHVFEPFRQQDDRMSRRTQGLGLELAIVRKLVELHGGRVTAESDGLDRGSTFRVQLPMSPVAVRAESHALPVEAPATSSELHGLRLLVVEDEADARELLLVLLRDHGAIVVGVATAHEALERLAVDPFDVMVSDVGLPELDGLELIRKVRQLPNTRNLPAIALTAYTRAVDRTRAIVAGFQAHIPKPVDPGDLVAVIASVVRRSQP